MDSDKPTSSFTTTKVNATTYAITEDDLWGERPIIYAKLHPTHPVIILNDTGCDEPSPRHKHGTDQYTRLRAYLESSLNPNSQRKYMIILTHCHFDHLNGITQFLPPSHHGPPDIVASSAGRDFIESDLETHGLFKEVGKPVPYFRVTQWVGSFERLGDGGGGDLGVTVLLTPGHTPDSLAWYDHGEMVLFVGDGFYRGAAVIWPNEGDLVEWWFSVRKLLGWVRSENVRAQGEVVEEGWEVVGRRVRVCCGHETFNVDGEEILEEVEDFFWGVIRREIPVILSEEARGEIRDLYVREEGGTISFFAPRRLVDRAREFFAPGGKIEALPEVATGGS